MPVQRGSISEVLTLYGRVAGRDELALKPAAAGRVARIAVKPGQRVEEGQVLLEADSKDLASQIEDVQTRIANSSARLAQTNQRVQADQARKQEAVTQAEVALAHAQSDLQQAQAAQAAPPAGQPAAQAAVAAAQAKVDQAEAARERVATSGPDPATVQAAQGDALNAQVKLDHAQADYDRLTGGPDPAALRTTERDVQKAQSALEAANATPATDAKSRAARDEAVANARVALETAQQKLATLRQPPRDSEVQLASYNLAVARQTLETAQARLAAAEQGPDQAALDKANKAVDDARAALQAAQAHLDEVNSTPSASADLRSAQERVAAAQAATDRARADAAAPEAASDTASSEPDTIQKAVDQDQARLDKLQKDLEAMRVHAPAAGTVAAILVRKGDALDPARTAVVLAKAGDPVLRAPVTDQDAAKLSVGQKASVQLDGTAGAPLNGSIVDLVKGADGTVQTALIGVEWGSTPPSFGSSGQIAIVLQRKDGVLVIPKKAVHSAGRRRYVESMDGTHRKIIDVQVGIVSAADAEIVSGLSEGEMVYVGI